MYVLVYLHVYIAIPCCLLQLPDDYPMEIIDNKSADSSSLPPLSDGRSSPAEELNNLDEIGDDSCLNDPGDHSEQATVNILNDLNAVTPPSSHSQSPVHTTQQENKPFLPAAPPDVISSVAPDNMSITPTHDGPLEAAPYEAIPSAEAQLAPVVSSPIEHTTDDAGEPLPPAGPPANLTAPASTTPVHNLSATFSGTPASLTLSDQDEAGLSTVDTIVEEHLGTVTLSSIGCTSDDNGEPLHPPVPPATLSAPASATPMPNPSATSNGTPAPPPLNDRDEAALLTVGTAVGAQVAPMTLSHTGHMFDQDDMGLPPALQPSTAIPTDTSAISPPSHPSPTFDNTSAPAMLSDQDEATSLTVGPSVEAQAVPTISSLIGHTHDHGDKSLPPTLQPTIAIPADTSATSPPSRPPAISDSTSASPTLSHQGEAASHTVGPSTEDQVAPMTSSPMTHTLTDHNGGFSPLAVPPATLSDIPTITSSTPLSYPLATTDPALPTLDDQVEKVENAADNESASMTVSPFNQRSLVAEDVHSSTYPPSSTIGEREAVVSSEISSSVPGLPIIQHKETDVSAKLNGNAHEEPTDLKDINFTLHEEPESFKEEENEEEIVQHEAPVISSDLQAPDRRYHSRARLDSLEDRNNLDTDSEMQQSSSESEKESDTEDYPGPRPTRKRQKRRRRSSLSISSSEGERDPFLEPRNDLSIVSSPEHELPHDGGGFGISLSVGEDTVKKHKEQSTLNDLSSQIPSPDVPQLQGLDVSTTGNLGQYIKDRNFHEGAAEHMNPTLTLPDQTESKKVGLLSEDQDQGGFQTQLGRSSPRVGARELMLQDESSELHDERRLKPPLSEQEMYTNERLLKPETVVTKGEPYQSLSDPGLSSKHLHSGLMPSSEEEPMRTEPTHQVTRTSDPILESNSSSSDQLQLPVRKSFSSHPPSIPPSLDRVDYLPKPSIPPVSSSAPSTGLHTMLDQPPPPFTHYAAPPPIFRAHVLEQQSDPLYSVSVVEDMDTGDTASQGGDEEEKETTVDMEQSHSSAGIGVEDLTGQRMVQDSLNSHHYPSSGSHGSASHLILRADIPPMVCV